MLSKPRDKSTDTHVHVYIYIITVLLTKIYVHNTLKLESLFSKNKVHCILFSHVILGTISDKILTDSASDEKPDQVTGLRPLELGMHLPHHHLLGGVGGGALPHQYHEVGLLHQRQVGLPCWCHEVGLQRQYYEVGLRCQCHEVGL